MNREGLLEVRDGLREILEILGPKSDSHVRAGSLGGRAMTEEQQRTRKRNMLKALAIRWPSSVRIQQDLKRLEEE